MPKVMVIFLLAFYIYYVNFWGIGAPIFFILKTIAMITEAQHLALIDECKEWKQVLTTYREKINKLKNELYLFAPGKTDHETVEGIEHFHNQFHIQLINLHDLKHEIKHHIFEAEKHPNFGHRIPHHYLKDKLDILFGFIENLEKDFHQFLNK